MSRHHLVSRLVRLLQLLPSQIRPVFTVLLLASVLSAFLVVLRIVASRQLEFHSLVWNLFLAWIPVFLAVAVCRAREMQGRSARLWLYAVLWLVFLPNAPYIVTDLIHLRPRPPVPIWVDMMILVSFAGIGLLLGFVALYLMQHVVAARFGQPRSWLFVLVVFGLTGLGVYIGRFLRWNSWDLVLKPMALGRDLLRTFGHPLTHPGPFVYATLFANLFLIAYLMLYSLTGLRVGTGSSRASVLENQ